jgi:FkbM family methyltransferase
MNLSIIKQYFEPKSILDIGSNTGGFYLDCVKDFPDSYYHLIEGNDNCEDALKSLNVDYTIALLSDTEKEVDFYTRTNEPICTGNSIYREKTHYFDDNEITIVKKRTQTLENLFSDKQFDLIKLDVQGSELDIMRGGLNLIKNAKGLILEVALMEYNENAPLMDEVYGFMKNINFTPIEKIGVNFKPATYELVQEDIFFINNNLL